MAEEEKEFDIVDYPVAEVERSRNAVEAHLQERYRELLATGGDAAAFLRGEVLERLGGIAYIANVIENNRNDPKFAAKLIEIFLSGGKTPPIRQENTQINVDVRGALQGILEDVRGKKPNA